MPYDPNRHHRRSIRLKGYDYTQPGAYFITIVTYERMPLFGEIVNGEMRLNEYGQMVRDEWFQTAVVRPYVVLHPDEFVVMPNHVHGIIWIVDTDADGGDDVGARRRRAPAEQFGKPIPGSIPTIVRSFKSMTTRRINLLRNTPGAAVWQRNYYEHIIRHERALNAIRQYIIENPRRWQMDRENQARTVPDPLAQVIWNMLKQEEADHSPRGER